MKRALLAFLLAPIASPLIITLQFGEVDFRLWGATLTVAYLTMAVFAAPLFYLFYRLGWRSWWQFVGAGVLACCLLLLWDYVEAPRRLESLPPFAWRFIAHAIPASLVFWFLAIRPLTRSRSLTEVS
jgi:hypothetical protein